MEKSDKKQLINTFISLVLALIFTWAFCKYLFVHFLAFFGYNLAWWGYFLLFIFFFGSAMASITQIDAAHKIAYDKIAIKNEKKTNFCFTCGNSIKPADFFCSQCGVKREKEDIS